MRNIRLDRAVDLLRAHVNVNTGSIFYFLLTPDIWAALPPLGIEFRMMKCC